MGHLTVSLRVPGGIPCEVRRGTTRGGTYGINTPVIWVVGHPMVHPAVHSYMVFLVLQGCAS